MKSSKTLFATLALLATPALALAEDADGDGLDDATGVAVEASASTEGTTDGAVATEPVMAAPAGAYPQAQILRPLTLNASKLRVQADVPLVRTTFTDGLGTSASDTSVLLFLGASYGINDQLEVGGSYLLGLEEFEAEGFISAYGRYALLEKPNMQLAVSAAFTFGIADSDVGLSLGAHFRYRLNEKMAIFTGATQGNNYGAAGAFSSFLFGLPGNQLSFGFDPTAMSLGLPVGFEFQAAPKIYLAAQTQLANIGIEPSGSTFIFADFIPLAVSAWYTQDKFDAGLTLGFPDLPDAADLFSVTLSGRYHL